MNQKHIVQASFLVALSGILYGFLGYLGTGILHEHYTLTTMLFWRFFIAGCWMLIFVMHKYARGHQFLASQRVLLFMFILGAIGYAGSCAFYFEASLYTGTGLAMVIFFSYPMMVALSSWLFHKNFSWVTFFILIVMVFGMLLLRNSAHHPLSFIGIFFGVLAAFLYAIYVVGSKKFSRVAVDSNLLAMMVCFGCAFIFLLAALTSGHFAFPHTLKSFLYFLTFGILVTALPIQLMLERLKIVSSMRASIISVLEPLVTVFLGVLLLHESISHLQIAGAVIILSGAILIQFHREL